MGNKTVMVLVIPEPKVRKATARAERPHKDKTRYTRKVKHKAPYGAFFMPGVFACLTAKGGAARPALLLHAGERGGFVRLQCLL